MYEWNVPYEANGVRITLCDPSTGHAVHTVALCEDEETAKCFVAIINSVMPKRNLPKVEKTEEL